MIKNHMSKLLLLLIGSLITIIGLDLYSRFVSQPKTSLSGTLLILCPILLCLIIASFLLNKSPKPNKRKQRKALRSLTPDQKTTLLDFLNNDCRTIGTFEEPKVKEIIQAGILYRNENIDGVNVHCINKYSQKYLKKRKHLLK